VSDLLAIRPTPLQAVREPLPTAPLSFGESLDLAFDRQRAVGNAFSAEQNYRSVFEQAAAAFAEAGERLDNPFDVGMGAGFLADLGRIGGMVAGPAAGAARLAVEEREREARTRRWDATAERLRAERPEAADLYPNSAELRLRADQEALAVARRAEAARPVASGFGEFLGSTGAIFTDPVQVSTLPIGAPWRLGATLLGNVVRTALVEAGVAGATQAAVELRADPFRQRLGLESEAAEQIGMAAAGGFVIGGTLRGILGLVAGRTLPDTPAGVAAGDAVRAARTQLIEQGSNPAGPEAAQGHIAALEAARAQMSRGEAVTVAMEPPRPTRYATEREARLAEAEGAAADAAAPGQRYVAFTPSGRAVTVEARVVELDALIASHSPDGLRNPAYPHDEGIQPRPRGAAPLQDQVRDIAARLEPARLMPSSEAGAGAPIVGPDLVVESGNGRAGALTLVYRDPTLAEQAAAYRAALAARGYDIEGMREPVVVASRVSALTPDERANFVREANARATAESTAGQRARDDARQIGDALGLWRGGDVDSVPNAPFVRRVLEALGPNERAGLLDSAGRLNAEGVRRIGDAVVARAYGDEAGELLDLLLSGTSDGMRQVAGALRDVAGAWARMRQAAGSGGIDPAMDVTADLVAALRLMNDARRTNIRVRDLVAQGDIERPPPTDTTRALLAAMYRDPDMTGPLLSRQAIGQRLAGYVDTAMDTQPGGGLFDLPPVRPGERIAAAARAEAGEAAPVRMAEGTDGDAAARAAEAEQGNLQGALDGSDEPPSFRFDPAPVDPAVAAAKRLAEVDAEMAARRGPATDRAGLQEARRVAAERDIPVPDGPDGQVRGAREILDEAEDALRDADEGIACMLGVAA
jgi:hypothetical protein